MRNFYSLMMLFFFASFSFSNLNSQIPINDDCSGIVMLGTAPNGTCTNIEYTNVNATMSSIATVLSDNIPSCWSSVEHDVWFQFDVPTNGSYTDFVVTVESSGATPIGTIKAALYRGDCEIDGLAELDCKVAGVGETSISFDASGLTPGLPYYIRVDDLSPTGSPAWGTFNVCVDSLPDIHLVCDGLVTDAEGTVYDSGGPSGQYSNNENCVFTICPNVPTGCIIFNLNYHELEQAFGPDDQITFFDGPNINSPEIIEIESDGTCFPIMASSGCLTIEFLSNGANTFAGFEGIWETTPGPCPVFVDPDLVEAPMADEILDKLNTLPSAVTVTSVTCNDESYATFTNVGDSHLGMDEGLMLTTGSADYVFQPNDGPGDPATDNNNNTDPDLVTLANLIQGFQPEISDACIVEMDVIAASDEISLEYIFGSDEYNGNVNNGTPSDVFGIWISGDGIVGDPAYNGQELLSVLPGTNTPVHLSNVNFNQNWEYYRYIYLTDLGPKYDGLTSDFLGSKKTLTASAQVTQCSTYHVKVAIGDNFASFGNEGDSGIFLSDLNIGLPNTSVSGNTSFDYLVEGCTGVDQLDIVLSNPINSDITLIPQITGTAINGVDYNLTLPPSITFSAGQTNLSFPITVINDNIAEGTETIEITFTYDYGCGESPFGNITIEIRDEPEFVVANGADTVFVCVGNSVQLNASGAQTYNWSPAGIMNNANIANPIATPTVSGPVTVNGMLGTCDLSQEIWLEIIDPQVNVVAMSDINICQGESVNLVANNNVNGFGLTWSPFFGISDPNSANVIATPTSTTTYTATVELAGCIVTDDITINVDPFQFPDLTTTDTVLCQGESLLLADPILGTQTSYVWSPATDLVNPNSPNAVATPNDDIVYTLTATSINNFCSETATVSIDVVPAELEIQGDNLITLCLGETTDLTAITSTGGTGFSWSPDSSLTSGTATTVTASPDVTTMYIAQLDVSGCTLLDTIIVQVDSLPVSSIEQIPNNDVYCKDEIVSFVSPSIDIGFYPNIEFLWTPNDGSFLSGDDNLNLAISAQQSATYTRTITNGNCMNTETVNITVIDPNVELNTSEIVACPGEEVAITASGAENYTWTHPNLSCNDCPNPTVTVWAEGLITVTGEEQGCTDSETIPVSIYPTPSCTSLVISPIDSIIKGQEVTLTLTHDAGPDATIEWNYNGNPTGLSGEVVTMTALEDFNDFNVVVTNEFGCSCTISKNGIKTIPQTNDVPNVFTPDGDGNNDFFNVVFSPAQGNFIVRNVRVYNRWGTLVYDNETPDTGWNGMHNDKIAPADVYVYFVEIEAPNGTIEQRKGDVTLIR